MLRFSIVCFNLCIIPCIFSGYSVVIGTYIVSFHIITGKNIYFFNDISINI